jgi:DUF177 domain-containing protein
MFDLGALHLASGEGRRFELEVGIEPFTLAGERYQVLPALIPVRLDVSSTSGHGFSLRLRFEATVAGPCMRCLEPAAPSFRIDAREVSVPGEGDDLDSPYVVAEILDLQAWANDVLALALPDAIHCRQNCAGLCPVCGADLNTAGPEHAHEREPDSRWAKLSELKFDDP